MRTNKTAYKLMRRLMGVMDRDGRMFLNPKLKINIYEDSHMYRSFRYLCTAGHLKRLEGDRFEITDLARINLLREVVKNRKPDGKMRVVMFDIPEKLRVNRNVFRHHLIELGFRMKQQSVWVSLLPCEDLIALVVKYHGLGRFVDVVVGKTLTL